MITLAIANKSIPFSDDTTLILENNLDGLHPEFLELDC